MTLIQFIRLFNRNVKLFLFTSLVLGVSVFLFTMHQPGEYQSETELYTGLASGVDVTDVNKSKIDFFSTSNAFDNLMNIIKSRQTLEETGERLLALHIMTGNPDAMVMSQETFSQLDSWFPASERKMLLVDGDFQGTIDQIRDYKAANALSKKVEEVFYNEASPYSHEAISAINVFRIDNSDLIRINYKWSDPAVCQKTLELLNDVFTRRMASIKLGQSNDVVLYFRKQVDESMARLQEAEEGLKNFRTENRIINYEEQTKSIAMMKEYLEDEYQKEIAIQASAEASLKKLESKLELNKEIVKYSDKILSQRSELAEISSKIASMEVYYQNEVELDILRKKQKELKAKLTKDLNMRYEFGRTTEGIDIRDLLQEWLKYTLMLDESSARMRIFNARKDYFMQIYDEFSPLGSRISQMEREINIEESNYLEVLHSLNQAMLKQKGEALSSGGLVVTFPPFFPLEPIKSKRILLVIVAFIIGFLLPLLIVILIDYLDQTIRTPSRVHKVTGLRLLGAYPNMDKVALRDETLDFEKMSTLAVGLICQNLLLEVRSMNIHDKKPKFVSLLSTEPGEGKSRMSHEMGNELSLLGFKVMVLRYKESDADDEFLYDETMFPIDREFLNTRSVHDLVGSRFDLKAYDFVFIEIPALLQSRYPVDLLEEMDCAVMSIKASRVWRKADAHALEEVQKVLKVNPRVTLNGVDPEDMEEIIGEVAKRRSGFSTFLRKIFTFEFSTRRGYKGQPMF